MARKKSFLIAAVTGLLAWLFLRDVSGTSRDGLTFSSPSGWLNLLTKTLQANGFSHRQAFYWFLVANMETAGYTSNLFVKYNNPWGMKQPRKRDTTSLGPTPSGFASYANLRAAADDLVLYLREFNYPSDFQTLDDQLIFMQSVGYFGDETLDSYRGKVVAWANKYGYAYA